MLSSQLISVSQTTKSPLFLRGSASTSTKILRTKLASTLTRNSQQTRAFRIGYWSSYLDSSYDKEMKRRHRLMKHKYMEALNRRLTWDHQPSIFMKHLRKGFVCSAWKAQDVRPGGRWVDMDRLHTFKGDKESDSVTDTAEPAHSYRRAMHDFVRSKTIFSPVHSNHLYATMMSAKDELVRQAKSYAEPRNYSSAEANSIKTANDEYEIDPITNRKVFRNASRKTSGNDPVDVPVKTYKGYRSQFQNLTPRDTKRTDAELDNYNTPFMYNEPDGKLPEKSDPVEQALKEFDFGSDGYKPFLFQEPDGKLPPNFDTVKKYLKEYDGTGYKPFLHNEPDGKLPGNPDPIQQGLKDYDVSTSYGAFRYREPDGKLPEEPDSVQESLKDYDTKNSYGSFRYNEPDGKFPEKSDSVQESLKDYDTTNSYGSFRYNEPDGKFPEKPDSVQESLKDYDTNTAYAAFRHNEPDGKLPESPDNVKEALKEYDQKQAKMTQDHTDGRRFSRVLKTDAEVKAYESWWSGGDFFANLAKGKRHNILAKDKPAERDQLEKDFQKSQDSAVAYANEGAAARNADFSNDHLDVEQIRADVLRRVNSKNAKQKTAPSIKTEQRKLTGNFVRDFPEEFEASWTTEKNGSGPLTPKPSKDAWGYDKSPKGLELSYQREVESMQNGEQQHNDGIASPTAYSRKPGTRKLQPSLDRTTAKQDSSVLETTKAKSEFDPYSRIPQGLETSYKEDCAKQGEGDLSVFVSSYGNAKKSSGKDKDLIREVRGIYEDKYGTIDSKHRQVPEETASSTESTGATTSSNLEPTSYYKILAYDPAMQSISIAETTSIVTDTASALTPAEVLLRLSNPAKFFPHFKPLQSQGYEIVSGSGDVLVFRKVRAATPPASREDIKKKTTNPIDGMQVATGRFASPTGFVNHDLPVSAEPAFKSNIDVRREEPVFSGKSSWQENAKPKPRKGGKARRVLVGGAIVGSGAYAVGVVSEYFRTGGADGKGPQGF